MISKNSRINLIKKEAQASPVPELVSRISVFSLAIFILILLGIFAFTLLLTRQRSTLAAEREDLANKVNQFREREGLILTLKNRAKLSQNAISRGGAFQDKIKKLVSSLPQGIEFVNVSSTQDNSVTFSAHAADSKTLSLFLDATRDFGFTALSLDNLTSGESGNYSFILTAR